MTRAEILEQYTVENGRICSPGKFEGEQIWAPYFYEEVLNGSSDDSIDEHNGTVTDVFIISAEDRAEFPELNDVYAVLVNEDGSGFAYCTAVDTEQDMNKLMEGAAQHFEV